MNCETRFRSFDWPKPIELWPPTRKPRRRPRVRPPSTGPLSRKPPELELEITESALLKDIELAREVLTSLQRLGKTVSLDDFGTGYSSLYHLRNLKFDKLKIDRSFVQSMRTNIESAKIVDAVLGLAKSLGMPVVAEGIEDRAALAHLTQRGGDYRQGYFFSHAVPAESAAEIVLGRALRMSA